MMVGRLLSMGGSVMSDFRQWWVDNMHSLPLHDTEALAKCAWQAARAQGGEVEPVAWVSPLVHGQQVTFYKPTEPKGLEDDELGKEWYCRPLIYADTHPLVPAQGEPDWLNRLNRCEFHDDDHEDCAKYSGQVPCSAAPTQGVPEGWKLVPTESTINQRKAAWDAHVCSSEDADAVYKAMLNAAPEAPNHSSGGWVRCGDIDEKTAERVARAFWRRIYPYRNDYGKELPSPCPVEFSANMWTALGALPQPPEDTTKKG